MISSRVSGNIGRIAAAVLAALVTVVLYLFLLVLTIFAGGLSSDSELCPGKRLASPSYSFSAFPLQHRCEFADGTSMSLIDFWKVNGILFGAIAVTLVLVVVAALGATRSSADVSRRRLLDSPGLLFAAAAATTLAALVGMVFLVLVGLPVGPVSVVAGLLLGLAGFLICRSVWALAQPHQHPEITEIPEPEPYPTAWERIEP